MKKRIAAGSGTSLNDVNKLLNQFTKMKKTMDRVGALGRSGNLNEESLENMMNSMTKQANIDPKQLEEMKRKFKI